MLCGKTDRTQPALFYFSLSVHRSAYFVYDVLIKIPAEFQVNVLLGRLRSGSSSVDRFIAVLLLVDVNRPGKNTRSQIVRRSFLTFSVLGVSPGGKVVILLLILHDTCCTSFNIRLYFSVYDPCKDSGLQGVGEDRINI